MRECPVGYVLREAPHIYNDMAFLSLGENLSPADLGGMSRYFCQMLRIYQNEMARIRKMERIQREANRHASIATGVVHG